MLRKIGLFSWRARVKACSPQGYQSTGLCACCRRYGDFSRARRFVCACVGVEAGTLTFVWFDFFCRIAMPLRTTAAAMAMPPMVFLSNDTGLP